MTGQGVVIFAVPVVCVVVLLWEAFDVRGLIRCRQYRRLMSQRECERFEREARSGLADVPVADPKRRLAR